MLDKFINWYNKIFTGFLVLTLVIPASLASNPSSRSSEIIRWESLKAPKGFILSNYLYNEMGCNKIWIKQVPAFQIKNPHVADPDVIEPGTLIQVQVCHDGLAKNNEFPVQKNQVNGLEVQKNQVSPIGVDIKNDDDVFNNPYIDLYGGFLGENAKDENVDTGYGLGVHGDLFRFLGYEMRLLGSPSVLLLNNEVRFKTSPDYTTRGILIVGMGNRIGLKNKDLDRLNKGLDSYSYGGLGIEMKPSMKWKFVLDLTSNFTKNFSPTVGVSAQKRLGSDYWLGLFTEFGSSRSTVDDSKEDRRYFTGGLKFSF